MATAENTQSPTSRQLLLGFAVLVLVLLAVFYWIWASIGTLGQRSDDLQARLSAAPAADLIAQIGQRQDDLEAKVAASQQQLADISPVRAELESLKSTLDALQTKVTTLGSPDLEPLMARVDEVEAKLAAAQAIDLAPITGDIATLKGDVAGIKG